MCFLSPSLNYNLKLQVRTQQELLIQGNVALWKHCRNAGQDFECITYTKQATIWLQVVNPKVGFPLLGSFTSSELRA